MSEGTIIIHTTEEGGVMKSQPWWGTEEDFEEIKRTGRVNIRPDLDHETFVNVAMVALCDVRELVDFKVPT